MKQAAIMQSVEGRPAPGPRGHWLVGNAPELRGDRLNFVMQSALAYGPVLRMRAFNVTLYLVSSLSGVQRILVDNTRNYRKNFETTPTIDMVMGHGLFTNDGEEGLKQRRLMRPVFDHRNVETFACVMTGAAERTAAAWGERSPRGEAFDVFAEMRQLTLRVVTEALFSANVDTEAAEIGRAINFILHDTMLRFDYPFYPPPRIPTPHNIGFNRALRRLDAVISRLIDDRREYPHAGNDVLDLLLNARDPETGEGMSDRRLRDEVVTLFIAGYETTAVTLSWTWYLLSQHPEIEGRWRAEVDAILRNRPPTAADLERLPLTRRVIDETLRLYPPAWIIPRKSIEEDEIDGYRIPANSYVSFSPYVAHHHPAYWDEPERFDPDRFLPERSAGRPRYAYFPFGAGPRQCIGRGFALMEAPLILATLAQRGRLTLAPGTRVEPHALVTLRPKNGLKMKWEERKP